MNEEMVIRNKLLDAKDNARRHYDAYKDAMVRARHLEHELCIIRGDVL